VTADWAWIPIVLVAAGAQTVRNAAQRSLIETAGTLPATFVRFLYGLPFAVVALALAAALGNGALPRPTWPFAAWLAAGAIAQLAATAFLIAAMSHRSFVAAVVYSKTEIIQIGIFSVIFLGESLPAAALAAIAIATAGVVLLSWKPQADREPGTWLSRGTFLGLAAGAAFALAAVGYRGAMTSLAHPNAWIAALYGLVWALAIQVLVLGTYLVFRDRAGLSRTLVEWRVSAAAGATGALASFGWFTAFALRSAVDVRIAGLIEVLYSYVLSRRVYRERVSRLEAAGILLIVLGIVLVSMAA
jgi:drug/metabolite transporter (DMT)-like permease